MTDSVLVGFDGSERAVAALEFAATEWPDAVFRLLYVVDPTRGGYAPTSTVPSAAEEWYEEARTDAEATLADGVDRVRDGVTGRIETETAVGKPAATIVEHAGAADVDHVVVGSHGRTGVSRLVLGSEAERVVRRSPVPVTVVR
ncbi:universal stress protein [Halobaculum sp. MBLA0143]|uniref:universal stress protein n=1 Tax=Halobaculum sp. MBLA0143 TaxID=3079933 RepID=UPI00352463CE